LEEYTDIQLYARGFRNITSVNCYSICIKVISYKIKKNVKSQNKDLVIIERKFENKNKLPEVSI